MVQRGWCSLTGREGEVGGSLGDVNSRRAVAELLQIKLELRRLALQVEQLRLELGCRRRGVPDAPAVAIPVLGGLGQRLFIAFGHLHDSRGEQKPGDNTESSGRIGEGSTFHLDAGRAEPVVPQGGLVVHGNPDAAAVVPLATSADPQRCVNHRRFLCRAISKGLRDHCTQLAQGVFASPLAVEHEAFFVPFSAAEAILFGLYRESLRQIGDSGYYYKPAGAVRVAV